MAKLENVKKLIINGIKCVEGEILGRTFIIFEDEDPMLVNAVHNDTVTDEMLEMGNVTIEEVKIPVFTIRYPDGDYLEGWNPSDALKRVVRYNVECELERRS